jgi:hypothetical protein
MVKIARTCGVLLFAFSIGCGGGLPSTSDSGTPPPHGGNLIRLPGGDGFVEVVQKKAASPRDQMTAEVRFYFLKKDGATLVVPPPSTGTFTLGKKTINLKTEGDGLVTPNGPPLFPKGDLDGVVNVELDGKATSVPLGVR